MASIGTTAVNLGKNGQLIQNLGPDDLYIAPTPSVGLSSGFRIVPGESLSFGYSNDPMYAISGGTSELRSLSGGTGMYAKEVPAGP